MSGQLVIDPARFARDRAWLSGSLAAADLPRLAEQLGLAGQLGLARQPDAGRGDARSADVGNAETRQASAWGIRYEVAGHVDARGHPALTLQLDGTVALRCQRCLGVLPVPIDARREIVLVSGADEFAPFDDEDESTDIIPAVARLDLRVLLEDEILLGLPLAPRHAPGTCRAEGASHSGPAERSTAFALLARLK
jgi:uncharacterized protein